MTIASEITRLQGAKSDIRQAIIDKGVNVGADLTLDEYAACISAIQSIKKFNFDLLVVGGGGSGGYRYCNCNYYYNGGGGGGGGGYICLSKSITEFDTHCFPVVVGCGAAGGSGVTWNQRGGDSCFGDVVACGGGSGASYYCYNSWGNEVPSIEGASGGSGGGGNQGNGGCPGSSIAGQGNIGGNWDGSGCYRTGGRGGGGASSAGCNNSGSCGGNGGDGCMNDMLGQNYYFSGGGGGGKGQNGVDGIGGNGGANAGADAQCYGGGGGGYSYGGNKSGSGKQGIVVVRYKTDGSCGITEATGGCKYTCGDYTIHCFTSDGAFNIVS